MSRDVTEHLPSLLVAAAIVFAAAAVCTVLPLCFQWDMGGVFESSVQAVCRMASVIVFSLLAVNVQDKRVFIACLLLLVSFLAGFSLLFYPEPDATNIVTVSLACVGFIPGISGYVILALTHTLSRNIRIASCLIALLPFVALITKGLGQNIFLSHTARTLGYIALNIVFRYGLKVWLFIAFAAWMKERVKKKE